MARKDAEYKFLCVDVGASGFFLMMTFLETLTLEAGDIGVPGLEPLPVGTRPGPFHFG